jgi:hypothetical protein
VAVTRRVLVPMTVPAPSSSPSPSPQK